MVLAFIAFVNVQLGSVYIPFNILFEALVEPDLTNQATYVILYEYRIPKVITAILAGAGLSVSGLLMQSLFKNPLAGPYVLGISNGATLGVALATMLGGRLASSLTVIGSAMLGSVGVLLLVLFMSRWIANSVTLLIVGLMIGSATGALVSVLQYYSDAEVVQSFLIWTFGSLSGVTRSDLWLFAAIIVLGIVFSYLHQKPLNAMLLGERYAQSMGVNTKSTRYRLVIITGIVIGTITSYCGPIAFVGLAVPHMSRLIANTVNHRTLILFSALIGAILMLVCDTIAQLPGTDGVLPINVVTVLLGAPVVVWLVLKYRSI